MHKITYCKSCLYPDTKPHLYFNGEGICSACINFDKRRKVNWADRKKKFIKLIKNNKSNSNYDCIIPV